MQQMNPQLETFVRQIAMERGWAFQPGQGEYMVEVPTSAGRTQVVHLMPGNDPDGAPMVYIWSPIGPAHLARRDPIWLLAYNTELSYGATAIFNDLLVIKESQLLGTADAEELTRMVFHVARAADGLEAQLLGAHMDQA